MALDKKQKQSLMGIGLAVIMVIGPIGWAFMGSGGGSPGTQTFDFYGQQFEMRTEQGQNLFFTTLQNQEIVFYNDPFAAENTEVSQDFKDAYRNKDELYLITDPDDQPGNLEETFTLLVQDVNEYTQKQAYRATTEEDVFQDFEQKQCQDLETNEVGLKYAPNPNKTATIYNLSNSNCYGLDGGQIDILRVRDLLILIATGLM